jgi:hypothetical protein
LAQALQPTVFFFLRSGGSERCVSGPDRGLDSRNRFSLVIADSHGSNAEEARSKKIDFEHAVAALKREHLDQA